MTNKKLLKIIAFAAAIAVFAGYFILKDEKEPERQFVLARRGDIVQSVSVTGRVEPVDRLDLAFERSGRVSSVYFDVGRNVAAGAVLAEQDQSELAAQLARAEAELSAHNVELQRSGVILANYYKSVPDVINDAYTKANDAVRKQLEGMFSDAEGDPRLTFLTKSSQVKSDIEFARLRATPNLNEWFSRLRLIDSYSEAELEVAAEDVKVRLGAVRDLLDLAMRAVLDAANLPQNASVSYQGNINTARANVNAAIAGVNGQLQNIAAQKAAIAAQSASVASFEANIENIKSQIAKTVLVSPISGTITRQDAKVGQIASAGQVVASVISAGRLEIVANVPEADIAKLKVGDAARVTLDAYGSGVIFGARIASVDPAATIIDGVPAYKTTFLFADGDSRPRAGMTANIDVLAASKENAIIVPQRAVITRDGMRIVIVDAGGTEPEERLVETGIRGSDGNIEIVSGVSEGERIIISF